jgi:dihydropteroate synthase
MRPNQWDDSGTRTTAGVCKQSNALTSRLCLGTRRLTMLSTGEHMLRDIYLRPLGLYPVAQAENAVEVWESLRLAGGWLDYTALEAIERNGSRVERRIIGMGGFLERDWGRRTMTASDLFEAIRAPRPRLAGLALDRPRIMGIVNVTPDSFSDGGRHAGRKAAVAHALRLVEEGADHRYRRGIDTSGC